MKISKKIFFFKSSNIFELFIAKDFKCFLIVKINQKNSNGNNTKKF